MPENTTVGEGQDVLDLGQITPEAFAPYMTAARQFMEAERAAAEQAGRPRYADAEKQRFPIYSRDLARASSQFYSAHPQMKAAGKYSDAKWAEIGEAITAALSFTSAAHDETEDVTLILQAMTLVRELIAREAIDGEVDRTYKLSDLVYCLQLLSWIKWDEEWEAYLQEEGYTDSDSTDKTNQAVAVVEDNGSAIAAEGDADMALTDEDILKLTEANKTLATEISSAIVASLSEMLKAVAAPAPVTAQVPAQASTEPVNETPVTEAPVVAPATATAATTEDEDTPADDKEDEDEDGKSKASAQVKVLAPPPADGLTPAERAGKAAMATANKEAEAAAEAAAEELERAAGGAGGGRSVANFGSSSAPLWGSGETEAYIQANRESVSDTLTRRLKGAGLVTASIGGKNYEANDFAEAFSTLFSKRR